MKNISKLLAVMFGLMVLSPVVFADSSLSVTAEDTMAGMSTTIKTTPTIPGSQVYMEVSKADGGSFEVTETAGHDGRAVYELPGFHTRVAGTYEVCVGISDAYAYRTCANFEVLAGGISSEASRIGPSEQTVRIGEGFGEVDAYLFDMYGNPISSHMVELISSRSGDEVYADSKLTDADGHVSFRVISAESGVSTYSLYDLTSGKTLDARAKVVYFESANYVLGHAVGASSGPVAYLGFEDLDENLQSGQSLTFTLEAYDETGQVVTNYDGVVGFSIVEGSEAAVSLPTDYTYVTEDLGVHTFSLGLLFNSAGSYTLKAEDLSKPEVFGTMQVDVTSQGQSITDQITISDPQAGSYSNNVHVIAGEARPSASLKVFDNADEIGQIAASSTGEFFFTTGVLVDGAHSFYVSIVDSNGVVEASSQPVDIMVDTTAPEVSSVEITPSNALPGSEVNVKVFAESGLAQAKMTVAERQVELVDTGSGHYAGKFEAPVTPGDYLLGLSLTDDLGNNTRIDDEYTLTVGIGGTVELVGDVGNLIAKPSDHQVNLSWTAPTIGAPVKFYRIYYGMSPDQLKYAIDTFGADTKWYLPNLKNDTEYYFAIVAVDNNGNVSVQMSNIVSAIPGEVGVEVALPIDVVQGVAGFEDIEAMETEVSDTGPEILWLVLAALLGGFGYSFSSQKQ